ncbi:alkylated DNA repair protein ALKBH8 homolog isoform X3 [Hevea brasiliensis]|uniref:alkylated DNA repair protein ALKBH8 homolog isoform X3 n=1 Tax=Hevea brasiliensis TaxID=3981 RepID=UPI0025DEB0D3|nr:alkylated DNA repair protein ALKBH8 homolog isoform X3 [Hevea brasiliensis]
MGLPRFIRPNGVDEQLSPNLYVANCGPSVGLSYEIIKSVFSKFGQVKGVYAADESGARVIVSYVDVGSAQAALKALDGHSCPDLGGRSLHIRFSVLQPTSEGQVNDSIPVSLVASELSIPGLYLWHDFINAKEEQELLTAVDDRPWNNLSKRRVQHYGYEFCYEVNEYPRGVGLSPHIDTHSAFEGLIFSLSLAGPCIMEFRRYLDGSWLPKTASSNDMKVKNLENGSNLIRRAIHLPPRSMLLLSGEARYAWHHYIPHHKIDMVNDNVIRRGSRRVSFTFRKVRKGPCQCEFPQYCDSQR